jgi:hypothetical protein
LQVAAALVLWFEQARMEVVHGSAAMGSHRAWSAWSIISSGTLVRPLSSARAFWDVLMMLLIIYSVVRSALSAIAAPDMFAVCVLRYTSVCLVAPLRPGSTMSALTATAVVQASVPFRVAFVVFPTGVDRTVGPSSVGAPTRATVESSSKQPMHFRPRQVESVVDMVYILDVFVNCRTVYLEGGMVVLDSDRILMR